MGGLGGAAALLLVAELWSASALREQQVWSTAAAISESYLGQLRACVDGAPSSLGVVLNNVPFNLDDGSDESHFIDARVLTAYSVPSLMRIYGYADRFGAVRGVDYTISHPAAGVVVSCQPEPNRLLVVSQAA